MNDIEEYVKELEKEGFGEVTDEINECWDFDKEPRLRGVFVGKKEGVGKNKSTIYTLEDRKGNKNSFWGSTVLDSRLKDVAIGDEVAILYLGKVESDSGQTYKNFRVFHNSFDVK
jgi:hypothetical protein